LISELFGAAHADAEFDLDKAVIILAHHLAVAAKQSAHANSALVDLPDFSWRHMMDGAAMLNSDPYQTVSTQILDITVSVLRDSALKPLAKWIGKHIKSTCHDLVVGDKHTAGGTQHERARTGIAFLDMFNKTVDRLLASGNISQSEVALTKSVVEHFANSCTVQKQNAKVQPRFVHSNAEM
jgi:hypothetical protein